MLNEPVQPEADLGLRDPYARRAQKFPRLSAEMAARVVAYDTQERRPKGTPVFARGERSVSIRAVRQFLNLGVA